MSTSSIITRTRRPSAPGEILAEFYLEPRGHSVTELAAAAGLSRKHVSNIIHGHASITADTAVWLGRVFGTSAGLWLGLQHDVDLYDAEQAVPADAVQSLAAKLSESYWHLR
jgi:addiction module HigA family antidote